MSPVIAYAILVLGGAWLGDRLIGLIVPDDPCHDPLMIITVAYFSIIFLTGMFYLVGLTLKITRPNRRHILPRRTGTHLIGCAALGFSALTPFIVLHGPHSGVVYGERVAVTEALERTVMLQQALSAFWRQHGHFPANEKELPALPDQSASSVARRIAFNAFGDITVEFASRRYTHLDGQTLVLRPQLQNGLPVWDCQGGSLSDLQRPAACRRSSVCENLLLSLEPDTVAVGRDGGP
ncbi:MAG TPA: pilin [Gammaproteobacteria bacterium]|nr:pilin [Gammaproteobacteria bacterium]